MDTLKLLYRLTELASDPEKITRKLKLGPMLLTLLGIPKKNLHIKQVENVQYSEGRILAKIFPILTNIPLSLQQSFRVSKNKSIFATILFDLNKPSSNLTEWMLLGKRDSQKSQKKVLRDFCTYDMCRYYRLCGQFLLHDAWEPGLLIFGKFRKSCSKTALFLGSVLAVYQAVTSKTIIYSTNTFNLSWWKGITVPL